MISHFFKKNSQIETLLSDYLEQLKASQVCFQAGMQEWVKPEYRLEDLEFHVLQTHKHESNADDIRDVINNLMYSKVLIPESRGDLMALIGRLDKIINCFETVLASIRIQRLIAPDFLRSDIDEIVKVSLQSCDCLWIQFDKYLKGEAGIREQLGLIDDYESRCDMLERRVLTKVFDSDLDPFLRLQLKELMAQIGDISDSVNFVSRRINILSLKRRV